MECLAETIFWNGIVKHGHYHSEKYQRRNTSGYYVSGVITVDADALEYMRSEEPDILFTQDLIGDWVMDIESVIADEHANWGRKLLEQTGPDLVKVVPVINQVDSKPSELVHYIDFTLATLETILELTEGKDFIFIGAHDLNVKGKVEIKYHHLRINGFYIGKLDDTPKFRLFPTLGLILSSNFEINKTLGD